MRLVLLLVCLQGFMVEYAAHFHSKLVNNSLDGLVLPSEAAKNIGLLSHSIGAGLATYMAQQAAKQHTPFKAVMYMAPQTQASYAIDVKTRGHWTLESTACDCFSFGLKAIELPSQL